MATIIQDRSKCIGCGACTAVCNHWEMAKDGKASPKGAKPMSNLMILEVKEISCHKMAADTCPVKCITIKEKK